MSIIKRKIKLRKNKTPDYIKTEFDVPCVSDKVEVSQELLELMPELKDILVKKESDIKITFIQVLRMTWNAIIVYTKFKAKGFEGLSGYALAISVADYLLQKLVEYKKDKK